MNFLRAQWWKWLSVAILFYALIGSFFVPLGAGITKISPATFQPDSTFTFQIKTYHAHLQSADGGKVQLWFKHKSNYYCPQDFQVIDDNLLKAQFTIPVSMQDSLKPATFDIVINNDLDGTFALRDALTLRKIATADTTQAVKTELCEPEVKHNKHTTFSFPYREILYETIRNTFYHVPMWFVMTMMVLVCFVASLVYLINGNKYADIIAHQAAVVTLLFGACGYFTGLIWSKYTWYIGLDWGTVVSKLLIEDIKLAGALVAVLVYIVYLIIRESIEDKSKSSKVAAYYSIFGMIAFMFLVFVIPRLTDSMHPGNGGNPAFSKYDLDSSLRMFFYPAVLGWILLGFWILAIRVRIKLLEEK